MPITLSSSSSINHWVDFRSITNAVLFITRTPIRQLWYKILNIYISVKNNKNAPFTNQLQFYSSRTVIDPRKSIGIGNLMKISSKRGIFLFGLPSSRWSVWFELILWKRICNKIDGKVLERTTVSIFLFDNDR